MKYANDQFAAFVFIFTVSISSQLHAVSDEMVASYVLRELSDASPFRLISCYKYKCPNLLRCLLCYVACRCF